MKLKLIAPKGKGGAVEQGPISFFHLVFLPYLLLPFVNKPTSLY